MTTIQTEMFGTSPFRDVLQAIDARTDSKWDKGNAFEQLTKAFFEQDALYREQFEKVWMWIEWPGRGGRTDTGIDLVAKNADDGEYTAIQCKFYRADRTINKSDVEPLITASGIYTKGGTPILEENLCQHDRPLDHKRRRVSPARNSGGTIGRSSL